MPGRMIGQTGGKRLKIQFKAGRVNKQRRGAEALQRMQFSYQKVKMISSSLVIGWGKGVQIVFVRLRKTLFLLGLTRCLGFYKNSTIEYLWL